MHVRISSIVSRAMYLAVTNYMSCKGKSLVLGSDVWANTVVRKVDFIDFCT